jgi:hypothetical protein
MNLFLDCKQPIEANFTPIKSSLTDLKVILFLILYKKTLPVFFGG